MRGSTAHDRAVNALEPVSYSDIPSWLIDDHAAALAAFARHTEMPENTSYKQPLTGCDPAELLRLSHQARAVEPTAARSFFETHFTPMRIVGVSSSAQEPHITTGFFEPELAASRIQTDEFNVPIFAPPRELVDARELDEGMLPEGYRFGWRSDDGTMGQAPDRAAIIAGALDGRASVIAWLSDPVDAFFMHVQGAARLNLPDGSGMRVTYAAKTGHPFTPIGKWLIDHGMLDAKTISMQTISAWLRTHPDEAIAVMNQNRSYIFFKESPLGDPDLGPVAAAKIQLTQGRSLAIDMRYHTFGTPIYMDAADVNGDKFRRLMIAQETGTAMRGPVRGDIFFGTGDHAGKLAGGIISPVAFHLFCPKGQERNLLEGWAQL